MEVDRIMNRNLAAVGPKASLLGAAKLMGDENVGCVLVVDEKKKPIGILTDRDVVVRGLARGASLETATVDSAMSPHPFTARRNDPIMLVARKMADKGVRRIPVVDEDETAVGIVSVDDLLTVFISEISNVAAAIVGSSKLIS
jgi:CBS domain-containing protein